MALSKFENDMSIVRKQPNQVVFQADKLKELFDKAGEDIKTYLNEILTEEIDAKFTSDNEYVNEEILKIYASMEEKIAELVDSSPEALNTLNELASALGNDPNFATTVLNKLSQKLELSTYNQDKELQNIVNNSKVDKLEGKTLSSNDFTDTYKNKVDTNEKDITILKNNTIPELQENIQNLSDKDGVFDNRVSNLEQTADDLTQVVFGGGIQESIQNNEDQIGYLKRQVGDLVPDEKGNITEQLTGIQINSDRIDYCEGKISDFDMKIGYVELALDELHNYAEVLIGGGK